MHEVNITWNLSNSTQLTNIMSMISMNSKLLLQKRDLNWDFTGISRCTATEDNIYCQSFSDGEVIFTNQRQNTGYIFLHV